MVSQNKLLAKNHLINCIENSYEQGKIYLLEINICGNGLGF